jgi:Protein of unknown function (DUF3352)
MGKPHPVLPVLAACAALIPLAGCGGSSSGSDDPASVAPPEAALFVEGTIRPTGSPKADVEALAGKVAGIEDLGQEIVSRVESVAAADGEPFDYAKDVEPWLGETAAAAFEHYDRSNFSGVTVALQTTDAEAAQGFIDQLGKEGGEKTESGSYEGVDFKVESGGGAVLGVIGDFLVFAEDERSFKDAVDASAGESLADVDSYKAIASHAPSGSLADAYVDIGGLIEQAGGGVDAETEGVLKAAGIELDEATALLSLLPGTETIEIDLATNLSEEVGAPAAEGLLESMPGQAFAAIASSEYGQRLQKSLDSLDANGIPGQVPPHQLKRTLKQAGVDLDAISAQLEDAAVFAVGSNLRTLGGAAVLTMKNPSQAKSAVSNIGLLLRADHTPGVTVVGGKAAGFSIHSDELGPKPLVIATEGDRLAIGYGLPATLEGLAPAVAPLSENPAFAEAKKALGGTPISGFVDGPRALRLVDALVSGSGGGFASARPYLAKIGYVGIGSEAEGDIAIVRVVAGVGR